MRRTRKKTTKENPISEDFLKSYEEIEDFWGELENLLQIYDSKYNPNLAKPELIKKYSSEISLFKSKLFSFLDLLYENKDKSGINWWSITSCIKDYCLYVANGRCKDIENSIIRFYSISREYAEEVIKGRWPELEVYMEENCTCPEDLYNYTISVIDRRWDKFEKIVASLPTSENLARIATTYCSRFNCRVEELEKHILPYPEYIFNYSYNALDRRWVEAEKFLLNDIEIATQYAVNFNFRWPEYEHKIRNKPKRISFYAKNVIKGKLPEELHNKMLMMTLCNDDKNKYYCDEYFDYLTDCEKDSISYLKSISEEERKILLSKV